MEYKESSLFGIQHIQDLFSTLGLNQARHYHFSAIPILIDSRLIEIPNEDTLFVQKKLYQELSKVELPNYYYSKRGSSYIDNAFIHNGNHYILKFDISGFFPSTSSKKVSSFFSDYLEMSHTVNNFLVAATTVNILDLPGGNKVWKELSKIKKASKPKHLITGGPVSSLLSFLVNQDMFDQLNQIAIEKKMRFSVYVDDFAFSSAIPFDHNEIYSKARQILSRNGYQLQRKKVKYNNGNPIKLTGVILSKKGARVPNSLQHQVSRMLDNFNHGLLNEKEKKSLLGKINAIRRIKPNYLPFFDAKNLN